jgi:hypothetical protein
MWPGGAPGQTPDSITEASADIIYNAGYASPIADAASHWSRAACGQPGNPPPNAPANRANKSTRTPDSKFDRPPLVFEQVPHHELMSMLKDDNGKEHAHAHQKRGDIHEDRLVSVSLSITHKYQARYRSRAG